MKMRKDKGFSLVELLVAMVLASLIIAGIMQVFLSSKQAFKLSESLVRVQENGRFAMSYISTAVRQSGSFGCVAEDKSIKDALGKEIGIENIKNHIPLLIHTTDAVQDGTKDGPVVTGKFDDPDTLQLLQYSNNSAQVIPTSTKSGEIHLAAGGAFIPSTLVLVSDCEWGDYIQAGPGTTNTVIFDAPTPNIQNRYTQQNKVAMATEVRAVAFSIKDETLMVKNGLSAAQELVSGIENIQFSFGVDTDNPTLNGNAKDNVPNYFDDFDNIPTEHRDKIIAIRIKVLAVSASSSSDNVTTEPQEVTFGGTKEKTIKMTDTRLRKTFETTIALRNRMN